MAFSTWQDLHQQMLDDLASKNWRIKSYEIEGRNVEFSKFSEFQAALEYVKYMADKETGKVAGRTYAKPKRPGW